VQRVAQRADELVALARIDDRPGERTLRWSEPLADDMAATLLN